MNLNLSSSGLEVPLLPSKAHVSHSRAIQLRCGLFVWTLLLMKCVSFERVTAFLLQDFQLFIVHFQKLVKLLTHSESFTFTVLSGIFHFMSKQTIVWGSRTLICHKNTHKFAFFYSRPKPGIELGQLSSDWLQGLRRAADRFSAIEM